jgi:hypothetical protein
MMRKSFALLAVVVIVWSGNEATQQATTAPIAYQATNDREQRAFDLLGALGNSQPTSDIVSWVVEWSLFEDRSNGAIDRNNPWNTTQPGFHDTGCNMTDCVRAYPTWQDGLSATVHTLTNGNYNELVAGMQTNDPQRALQGLVNSPWAASHYNYGVDWPQYQFAERSNMVSSNPIALSNDDCGWNVRVALGANGGALRSVVLQPNEMFSFNATMGNPAAIEYRMCAGVPGGNWCNLAARYAQVARAIGLAPQFQDHGVGDLGGGIENSVAIWNESGQPGVGQDLLISNTTDRVVTFQAQPQGDSIVIVGETH